MILKSLRYLETPVIELPISISQNAGVQFSIKREDMNHDFVSGNKWWKLKDNLAEASRLGHEAILTFGGAYSNHIYATAAAARELGFKSVGVIRGERIDPLNSTLAFAESCGMKLHFVSREAYRKKTEHDFIETLHKRFGDFYLVPEGGTNELAVKGCEELGQKLAEEIDFDYLCLPAATGGTLAGLAKALPDKNLMGYAVLKNGEFLVDEVRRHGAVTSNLKIETGYHFGGYGKMNGLLKNFILEFETCHHPIQLDPVYTAKAMFGVLDQINQGSFPRGSKILFLHTGGLQGRAGFSF